MGTLMEASDANLATGVYRRQEIFIMGAPGGYYPGGTHAIPVNTREAVYDNMEPVTIKSYTPYINEHSINHYPATFPSPRGPVGLELKPSASSYVPDPTPANLEPKDPLNASKVQPPPKKKWIRDFYLEEPKSPLAARGPAPAPALPRVNGALRCSPPPAPPAPPAPAPSLDHGHSSPRINGHCPPQIPSPPSVGSNGSNGSNGSSGSNGCNGSNGSGSGSNGSTPRAGTREVHNKLEKNRRAHLKECFEMLKRQLPATPDDKKTSNLSILASAIRYIQVLRRKERECEHEMERLAREKIAAQQRLAALKREVSVLATTRPTALEAVVEEKIRDERVNGQVLGIPISITASPPPHGRLDASPPRTLNLSTKLRTLPIQITPTSSQVVRTSYGTRHNTLTLTTLAPAEHIPTTHTNGHLENGMTSATLSTTLVHPAQIHLPLSQVVSSGGLVVGGALQLLSTPGALRVLHAPQLNGVTANENGRLPRENGITSPPPTSDGTGVVVSGLSPHVLHSHTLAHKMVETQMVKASVAPLTVSAQYLTATTIVKPVVVVSSAANPPSTSA